jgi:hypothetical protein
MGGREHTEVRALDPGRSSFSCLSLSLYFILSITQLLVGGRNLQQNFCQGETKRGRLCISTYL